MTKPVVLEQWCGTRVVAVTEEGEKPNVVVETHAGRDVFGQEAWVSVDREEESRCKVRLFDELVGFFQLETGALPDFAALRKKHNPDLLAPRPLPTAKELARVVIEPASGTAPVVDNISTRAPSPTEIEWVSAGGVNAPLAQRLILLLQQHAGETGENEGAEDVLRRKLAEAELWRANRENHGPGLCAPLPGSPA
jgi:hypothetical protein